VILLTNLTSNWSLPLEAWEWLGFVLFCTFLQKKRFL
jgi:hypothetical protein